MNILYYGAGFVGACSAAVTADSGHNVLVFDINDVLVSCLSSGDRDMIENCLFEKGLGDLLIRNKERLSFTTDTNDVRDFLDDCQAVFMCLPTPEVGETGESDLKYFNQAAEQLIKFMKNRNSSGQTGYVVIVNKSTVPIGMADKVRKMFSEKGIINFDVVSNPEFLVEGKAVENAIKPDRIVVGADSEKAFEVIRKIYQRFYDSPNVEYIEVNPGEAAAGKLLANYFLFNKLMACFDVIGRTCEAFEGLKFENVRKILTTDKRIGEWGFYDSLYCGGSCFIKDSRSLAYQLKQTGREASLVDSVYSANKRQLNGFMERAERELGFNWAGKTASLLGLSFKRDTNDIRNSPAVEIVKFLLGKDIKLIKLYDPVAGENFNKICPDSERIIYSASEKEALSGTDAVIVGTDWPQFRGLGDLIIENGIAPIILDGRRMLHHQYDILATNGCNIIAVGSPVIRSNK